MSLRRSQQCAAAEGAKYSHSHVALAERVTQRACGAFKHSQRPDAAVQAPAEVLVEGRGFDVQPADTLVARLNPWRKKGGLGSCMDGL